MKPGILRSIRCALHLCPCRSEHDETHCFGVCADCGKRVHPVSHEEIRRYIERARLKEYGLEEGK